MSTLLFIGDIVGEAGVSELEFLIPALIHEYRPDFIVANAENLAITAHPYSPGPCGMTPHLLHRLFVAGIDLVTGGNHSWDGPYGISIHDDRRVIRPLNFGSRAPGRGAAVIDKPAGRLGVINLMSRTAMSGIDTPYDVFERQLESWGDAVDLVLVDFHGESATEKLAFAFAVAGRVAAVLGTHTHVPTLDTRILPGGTAYVTDVGMTGPSNGIQGYAPERFANAIRYRLPGDSPLTFATGEIELGAVLVRCQGNCAVQIQRVVGCSTAEKPGYPIREYHEARNAAVSERSSNWKR